MTNKLLKSFRRSKGEAIFCGDNRDRLLNNQNNKIFRFVNLCNLCVVKE